MKQKKALLNMMNGIAGSATVHSRLFKIKSYLQNVKTSPQILQGL